MEISRIILFVVLFAVAQARKENVCADPLRNEVRGEMVDLTHPFDDTTQGYPGLKPFQLEITNKNYTDAGYWLQMENYGGAIHVGTHMDAPCHVMKGQWSLEDIPLDRFMAPAAVVDIRYRTSVDRNANLEIEDLLRWEEMTGQTLDETIVLVNSGWSEKWSDNKDFLGTDTGDISEISFPGISPRAAEWLARNRKIYGIGIDTTSLDNGQAVHRRAHEAFFRANIYGLENVANLQDLPAYGAFLFVYPMRIKGACGAPARIIAVIPGRTDGCWERPLNA